MVHADMMSLYRPSLRKAANVLVEPDLVQTFPAMKLTSVCLFLVAGNVTVETSERQDVRVIARGLHDAPQLMPAFSSDGHTLKIDGESETALALLHPDDRLSLTVQIPTGLDLTLRMLAGSLQLNGQFGALDVRLRFGSVSGCAPAQRLKLRVFAGDVRLGGLTGIADVQLSLGDLTMAWATLNDGDLIHAQTFIGETRLDLPDHMTLLAGVAVVNDAGQPERRTPHTTTETLEVIRTPF